MRGCISFLLIVLCGLLTSCAKQETAKGPHANVFMRDGSEYSGTVMSNSPAELTVKGDDNTTRTIRLSSDTRYQLASEPVDERWIGEHPIAHGVAGKRGKIC